MRTRGRPRLGHGEPPLPPPPPEDEEHPKDDDGHRETHFRMVSISSAPPGWIARFTRADVPVVAWAIVEMTCQCGNQIGDLTDGLVLRPGWTVGPEPVGWLTGDEDDQFGNFEGYFPIDGDAGWTPRVPVITPQPPE